MNRIDDELLAEQRRVDYIVGQIQARINKIQREAGAIKEHVVEIRKEFWDDVTVNLDHPDEVSETFASLKQQAEVLSERERSHQHSHQQLNKLNRLTDSPYFGRIDFKEAGDAPSEQVYIGITSFLDDSGEQFLIYDWRAPISGLYYDYPPGPAAYVIPNGETICGTIGMKRQFIIRNGRIQYLFDTGLTIGDELLQQVLGRNSNAQMKSIVSTIQKEQNQIIRNEHSRLLIVQGAAGSGKTSAALQRVAYLLYRYRNTLRAEQIVLFSPNPMFNSYVSTVLPELGEENMTQTTFQYYLEHRLNKEFEIEDPFSQMEYVLTSPEKPGFDARLSGIRFKSSNTYLELIHRFRQSLEQSGMVFKDLKFRGKVLVSAGRMTAQFYTAYEGIPLGKRVALLSEWLLKELSELEKQQRHEAWVEEEIELLDLEDYQRAFISITKKQKTKKVSFDDFMQQKHLLAGFLVRERFKPLRKKIARLRFIDIPSVYAQLFDNGSRIPEWLGSGELPEHWREICEQTLNALRQKQLFYEDAAPYLFLKELIEGFQTNLSIRHVFIDEAQDYSPFQFEFLKRLFPSSKMTVLGDLNQAIFVHAADGSGIQKLLGLFGSEHAETIRLTRSYRSTRQIVEFTRGMLEDQEPIVPFNREGEKPEVIRIDDPSALPRRIAGKIGQLRRQAFGTIAVICKTAAESKEAYEALKMIDHIHLVTKGTMDFEKGVLVIPSYLAKGVEFDAVIIYDGSKRQYGRENERKLFYTACTRAMHALCIFSAGDLSPFITGADSDTYVLEDEGIFSNSRE
ncbi:RNA polymerase recycling motor HelD [Ferviditalea candida]|uniref:RNA polymerase recycling motor HelD n=1 Tax=Ferviditalea candida TaxID=3108399 RepID=A0ABU5ZH41_9BACL|nr:RNA polymerase recycling motor HelD [Paenibacillaceae bacterium T2]